MTNIEEHTNSQENTLKNDIEKLKSLRQNVDLIELGDRKIYLVGTAHVSAKSVELTEAVIREIHPDAVAVELCDSRYKTITDPESWRKTDIITVIKTGRLFVLLTQLVLAAFQKKIAKELKTLPGAEMVKAISVANEIGADIILADRDVKTTLKRVWRFMSYRSVFRLIPETINMLAEDQKVTKDEIEKLKTNNSIDDILEEFTKSFPEIKTSLISERDEYLAGKLQRFEGKTLVAIVGAGHVPGIKKHIFVHQDLAKLEEIPPKTLFSNALSWALPAVLLGLLIAGFVFGGKDGGFDTITKWILFTGISAAFGSLLALSHPLTIVSAFLAAPLTTLHPFLASGMVSAFVEAWLRKPQVSDFETVVDSITTVKGWYTNKLARVFLVLILTNLCGTIGMLTVIPFLSRNL